MTSGGACFCRNIDHTLCGLFLLQSLKINDIQKIFNDKDDDELRKKINKFFIYCHDNVDKLNNTFVKIFMNRTDHQMNKNEYDYYDNTDPYYYSDKLHLVKRRCEKTLHVNNINCNLLDNIIDNDYIIEKQFFINRGLFSEIDIIHDHYEYNTYYETNKNNHVLEKNK